MESHGGEPEGTLVLVHTVAPLIDEFTRLCDTVLPRVKTFHILDEPLLERITRRGGSGPTDMQRLTGHIAVAVSIDADAVLVTCSTTSMLVDAVRGDFTIPVVKIDEAMAAEAVMAGPRVALIATNHTTLQPSKALILAEAARAGREVDITAVIVADALSALLGGDDEAHDRLVAQAIADAAVGADVVVLAQASMARACALAADATVRVPVLSSPELALRQVSRLLTPPLARPAAAAEPASR